jgi:hypothetical protein
LGVPVDPEVKMIQASSVGSGSASTSDADPARRDVMTS